MTSLLAIVARLTGLSPLFARLALAGGLVAAIVAGWGLHQWRAGVAVREAREAGEAAGKAAERAAWEAVVAEERRRQADIAEKMNERAVLEAARLRTERDDLAKRLEDLDHEALADPTGDRVCLSPGGVRRLDAIR